MITRRALLSTAATAGAAAGLGLAAPSAALAKGYPARDVHFILPFPAGPTDVVSRLYAQKVSKDWKVPVVVDERPGATGSIGTEFVVRAKPDGYTLLFTVDLPISMAPNLIKVPYDPKRDLVPICAVVEGSGVLVVNASTGIKTLAQFVAAAKEKPGTLTYSSAGIGSPAHLCGAMMAQEAGISLIHVPYKAAAPAMNAVLSGTVTAFCGPIAQSLPYIKSGKFNALGVSGPTASPLLPDVKPLSASYPGLVISNWYGLLAPAHTPAAIRDKLEAELKKIYAEPALQQKLQHLGLEPKWTSGSGLEKRIAEDLARYHKFVVAAHIHAG
jgi:tripartite-type tricarboxylate transporter receptor subunit TctC